jgi:hypothetical protein
MSDDDTPSGEVHQAVLGQIQDRTDAESDGVQNAHGNLWTSRERLRADAVKPHTDYDKSSLSDAISALEEAGEIIAWHGLLAPTTEDHLRAIIETETQSTVTRSLLVGRCNTLLQRGAA